MATQEKSRSLPLAPRQESLQRSILTATLMVQNSRMFAIDFRDQEPDFEYRYCMDPDGGEVLVLDTSSEGLQTEDPGEENCHFHAGVEYGIPTSKPSRRPSLIMSRHCTSPGESESESASSLSCELRQREYDVPLRIGTLFVIFVTSGIAVFGPVLLTTLFHVAVSGLVFTVIKQFGTGIILSTALIHVRSSLPRISFNH